MFPSVRFYVVWFYWFYIMQIVWIWLVDYIQTSWVVYLCTRMIYLKVTSEGIKTKKSDFCQLNGSFNQIHKNIWQYSQFLALRNYEITKLNYAYFFFSIFNSILLSKIPKEYAIEYKYNLIMTSRLILFIRVSSIQCLNIDFLKHWK